MKAAVERSLELVDDFDDFLRDGLDVPEVDEGSDSNALCDAPDVRPADPDNRAEPGSESVVSAVLQLGQDEAALLKERLFFEALDKNLFTDSSDGEVTYCSPEDDDVEPLTLRMRVGRPGVEAWNTAKPAFPQF